MALDFPDAPTNGQVYNGFMWDSTSETWRVRGSVENPVGIGSTTGSPTIATSGGFTYYGFTVDGSITVDVAGLCDILVIAGGGGGGTNGAADQSGGGGGAGGVLFASNYFLSSGTHTIVVGDGGAGSALGYGTRGEDSTIAQLYAMGGGNGGKQDSNTSGGSGGGSGSQNVSGSNALGYGLTGQGNNSGGTVQNLSSGGGGGAGGVGGDGVGTTGGAGGAGTSTYSDWGIALSLGELSGGLRYFAGGGGAGGDSGGGAAGIGGGGAGATGGATGGDGTDYTGGGGGGAENQASGAGGSGVVIVRVTI